MATSTPTLFITSSGADVVVTGNVIKITGLPSIFKPTLRDYSLKVAATEVPQVVTIGATLFNPSGSTRYKILIGDNNRRTNGKLEVLKPYSYTTPADITTLGATPALQREAIYLQLVAIINRSSSYNFVTAASLGGGNGITITDNAGYYPYNQQGMSNRLGASTVKLASNIDGSGFSSTNMVLTTAAVYAFGQGQDLLNLKPSFDFASNNLIAGEYFFPKTAGGLFPVVGQKYNAFNITFSASVANGSTVGEGENGNRIFNYTIWVDNGTGTSTANLAGYGTFKTALDTAMA